MLAGTRRIRVGVGLLPAAARNVAFAAMEVATLAQLHPGRLDIAVGHGMPEWMRSVGAWPASPLTLLGEYIHTLKTLLAGQQADTDGRYIRLDGVRLDPSTLPEHTPDIFAGVRGPKSLALSGEVADGTLLAEPVSPEYVRQALTSINPQRPHRLTAYNITVVDGDPHNALAAARPALQPLGDPDWAPHIVAQAIPEEWAHRLALTGTPDQVRARVNDLFESGVTTAVLSPVGPDYRSALASLAKILRQGHRSACVGSARTPTPSGRTRCGSADRR